MTSNSQTHAYRLCCESVKYRMNEGMKRRRRHTLKSRYELRSKVALINGTVVEQQVWTDGTGYDTMTSMEYLAIGSDRLICICRCGDVVCQRTYKRVV